MNDLDITVIGEDNIEHNSIQLPMNYLLIGELENDDVKVYIRQEVYRALEEYSSSDIEHELGTIILGDYSDELGKMNVVVSDFIYAKYTDASASTLTFTHKTWEYIHEEHEKKYSEEKIIGWQHTHPGYGVFLSNYDMFIQENFFSMPFQIAYVIDPIQHIRGFFQWKGGKVEKLKGFYIYDDVGKKIKIDYSRENNKSIGSHEKSDKSSKKDAIQTVILGMLCFAVCALLISNISLHKRYESQMRNQDNLELSLEEQKALIADQSMEIESIKEVTQIGESEENCKKIKEDQMNNTASDMKSENLIENRVYFKSYIIQSGDTL